MLKRLNHYILISLILEQGLVMGQGMPANSGSYVYDIKNKVNFQVCRREQSDNIELCNLKLSLTDFGNERYRGEVFDSALGFIPYYSTVKKLFYTMGGASEDTIYQWPKYVSNNFKAAINAIAFETYEQVLSTHSSSFESREEVIDLTHQKLQENVINFIANPNITDKQRNFIIMTALTHINKMVKINSDNIVELDKKKADKLKEELEGREPSSFYGSLSEKEVDENIEQVNEGLTQEVLEKTKKALEASYMAKLGNNEEYRALSAQIDELKLSNEDQSEKIKELENRQEQILKETSQSEQDFQERARLYQEASHAATIAGVVLSFTGSPDAQRVVDVAQNAIKAAQAIDHILNADLAGQMAGASTLGPYAVLAVAAFNIFSAFKKKGPNINQVILKQIQKLSELMIDIHKSLNSRFDRLEYILDQSIFVLLQNFQNLHYRLDNIQVAISEMKKVLDRVENKIDILAINNDENFSEELIDDYKKTVRFIFNYDEYNPGMTPSFLEVKDAAENFHTMAIDYSRRSALAGHSQTPLDKRLVYSDIHEFHINSFAKSEDINVLSSSARMPNPYVWNQGVESFLNLYYEYPQYQKEIGIGYFKDLYETGLEIQKFTDSLARNRKVYRPLFNEYDEKIKELKSIIKENVDSKLSQKLIDSINTNNRQVIKQLAAEYKSLAGELSITAVETMNTYDRDSDIYNNVRTSALRNFVRGSEFLNQQELRELYPFKIMKSCNPNKSYQINESLLLHSEITSSSIPKEYLVNEILGGEKISYCYELEADPVIYGRRGTRQVPLMRSVRKIKIRAYINQQENIIANLEHNVPGDQNVPIYPTSEVLLGAQNYNGPFYGMAAVWVTHSNTIRWPNFLAKYHNIYKNKKLGYFGLTQFNNTNSSPYLPSKFKENSEERKLQFQSGLKNEISKLIHSSQILNDFDNLNIKLDYLNYFALNSMYLNDLDFRVRMQGSEGMLSSMNIENKLYQLFNDYQVDNFFEELERKSVDMKKDIYLALRDSKNTNYYLVSETLKILKEELKKKEELHEL